MTVVIVKENYPNNACRNGSSFINIETIEKESGQLSYLQKTKRKNTNQHQLLPPLHLEVICDPCRQHQREDVGEDGDRGCASDEVCEVKAPCIWICGCVPIRGDGHTMEDGYKKYNDSSDAIED
jgi:hypothetical protein